MAALPGLSGRRSSFLVTSRRLAEKSAVGAGALATSASGPAMRSASDLGGSGEFTALRNGLVVGADQKRKKKQAD